MRKITKVILSLAFAVSLAFGIFILSGCANKSVSYTVTFVTNGGSEIEASKVKKGEKLEKPTAPTRGGYVFDSWYEDDGLTVEYDFTKAVEKDFSLYAKWTPEQPSVEDKTLKSISYGGQTVTLSEKALYVDATLKDEQLGNYAFKSLQDCIAKAKSGTKGAETKIYVAPDVYWTDDYTDTSIREKDNLIGLKIPQSYIYMIGMTGNRDDVVIASDRGQNAGANGNYNTLGIADGFHAKDITFGNYCNVDLVYAKDTTKNHTKRQEAITQAQVITKVPDIQDMDEWFFENCSFVSRLNLFSFDERPDRSFYDGCHFECTDDSIGTGKISLFKDCDFDFYSNTPCGSGSRYMQSYLGCKFTTHFPGANKTLTLCKHSSPFTFIDCEFGGNIEGMTWKNNTPSADLRQVVSNNTKDGQPFVIDPDHPELSVTLPEEAFKAFKVGNKYNVYNLLNNALDYEEWDPLGQKEELGKYASPWNIQLNYEGKTENVVPVIVGDKADELTVTPEIFGYNKDMNLVWGLEDGEFNEFVKLNKNADGTVTVTAENKRFEDYTVCLTATVNGLKKVLHINVTMPVVAAPSVGTASITAIDSANGLVKAAYTLEGNPVDAEKNTDVSVVEWYRSADDKLDASDIKVATTTFAKPDSVIYKDYALSLGDVGYYLIATVTPQYKYSEAGESKSAVTARKITADDLTQSQKDVYYTDFTNLAYTDATYDWKKENPEDDKTAYCDWTNDFVSGVWYGGYYLPAEYKTDGIYKDKHFNYAEERPFTFAEGCGTATKGTYGMQTTTQGARLVYVDETERTDMALTVELSPEKTAAQGFGSAKQFMEVYFKYDAKTMSGYGLRITREDGKNDEFNADKGGALASFKDYVASSCSFQIMEYSNGIATPLTEKVVATTFLKGCKVELKLQGNTLTCDVTTTSEQDSTKYPADKVTMPHEVHLTHTFTGEVNKFGGFGFQHTGTAGAGKSGNRTTVHYVKAEYTANNG